jgi:hypothetical protein
MISGMMTSILELTSSCNHSAISARPRGCASKSSGPESNRTGLVGKFIPLRQTVCLDGSLGCGPRNLVIPRLVGQPLLHEIYRSVGCSRVSPSRRRFDRASVGRPSSRAARRSRFARRSHLLHGFTSGPKSSVVASTVGARLPTCYSPCCGGDWRPGVTNVRPGQVLTLKQTSTFVCHDLKPIRNNWELQTVHGGQSGSERTRSKNPKYSIAWDESGCGFLAWAFRVVAVDVAVSCQPSTP